MSHSSNDYIDAEVGPDGRLYVAYIDACRVANCQGDAGWVAVEAEHRLK